MGPLNPETFATYGKRLTINRNSAYSPPKWAEGLLAGLPGFSTAQCSAGITATLDPETPKSPAFQERVRKRNSKGPLTPAEILKESEDLFSRIKKFAFAEQSGTASVPAPACTQQAPIKSIYGSGEATTYQHTFEQTGE